MFAQISTKSLRFLVTIIYYTLLLLQQILNGYHANLFVSQYGCLHTIWLILALTLRNSAFSLSIFLLGGGGGGEFADGSSREVTSLCVAWSGVCGSFLALAEVIILHSSSESCSLFSSAFSP